MMVTFEGQVPNLFLVLAMNFILMTCGDQTCDFVDLPEDRVHCNSDGDGRQGCEKIKCCFKEEGAVWCSFPESCSIEKTNRVSCDYYGSSEDCLDRGCCFFADKHNKDGGDECFLSKTCAKVPVRDRIDCAHTSPADCLNAGCCYDTSCFLTEGCADDSFYRDGDCLQCNCQSVCDKNTGSCGTRCNHGFISEDCQEAQTPIVDEFSQSNKGNSGQPSTFVCYVTANEADMQVTATTSSGSYQGRVTSGDHPDYEFANTFDDVVVEKDEIVTCRLTPGDDKKQITADAYIQPVLTNSPWLTDVTKTQMTVRWDAWDTSIDIGDGPIELYEVWYKVTGENDFTRYDTTEDQTSLPVTGLTPYTSYTFAVKTYRPGAGGGGDLSPKVTDQTLCDVPLGQPIIEEANTLSETEISVSWKINEPDLEPHILRCDSLTSYTVHYRVSGTSSAYEMERIDPDKTSTIIDGLNPCTEYEISVSMDNVVGHGQLSNPIFNETTPQKVEELSAVAMSSSEINVTWAKPSIVDCPLERYELAFYQDSHYECGALQRFDLIYLNATEFEHVVRDLYASTEYRATVTAYTNGGGGPPDLVVETTHENFPTIPRDVMAQGISDTKIEVTWSAPMCPNGAVILYFILFWQSSNQITKNVIVAPRDCIDYTEAFSCSIGELQPETNYSAQISARNGCCLSAWSDIAETGTLSFQPSSGLSVGGIVFTSLILTLVIILVALLLLGYLYSKRTGKS